MSSPALCALKQSAKPSQACGFAQNLSLNVLPGGMTMGLEKMAFDCWCKIGEEGGGAE